MWVVQADADDYWQPADTVWYDHLMSFSAANRERALAVRRRWPGAWVGFFAHADGRHDHGVPNGLA